MRRRQSFPTEPFPDLINMQEPANENYLIVTRLIPALLRTLGLTVAVFTRFHFGRNYITAHTNAVLGVLIMTGGMGTLLLLMVFAGFFNQQDSGLPLDVFLGSALLLSMLHRAIAFIRALQKSPEPAMFPGKSWVWLVLPIDYRWVYILIEPGLAFAIGFLLSRLNWPLGLWIMTASVMLAATGFVDMKNLVFNQLDKRDAEYEEEVVVLPVRRDQVFFSYSHKDRDWLEKFQTMLKPIIRNQTITVWDDTQIKAGEKWKEEIKRALASAKVAVFLVSPNFLASDFIAAHELPSLLRAAKKTGLIILWVSVSHCLYTETEIAEYQAANDPKFPLDNLTLPEQHRVIAHICQQIKEAAMAVTR